MAEWCQQCGRNIALVGRVHRCVPIRGGLRPSDFAPAKGGANVVNMSTLPDRYKVSTAAPNVDTVDKPVDARERKRRRQREWIRKKRGKE